MQYGETNFEHISFILIFQFPKKPRGYILGKQFLKGDCMELLTLPLLDAFILLVKMTVIFCWGVIMIGMAIRVILGSIMAELLDPREEEG